MPRRCDRHGDFLGIRCDKRIGGVIDGVGDRDRGGGNMHLKGEIVDSFCARLGEVREEFNALFRNKLKRPSSNIKKWKKKK